VERHAPHPVSTDLAQAIGEARACTLCTAPQLPLGPKPILQGAPSARLLIIGQAPGTKAHMSGVPWDDQSGKRLREWIGLSDEQFYNPEVVAIIPAGLCYPGAAPSGGDNPPIRQCASIWHPRLLPLLKDVRLTLLVGLHAQKLYLKDGMTLSERVRLHPEGPLLPLPHPSWRVAGWIKQNPWFEAETLPRLQARVQQVLGER